MGLSTSRTKRESRFTVQQGIRLIATDKESHVMISRGGSSVHRLQKHI